MINDSAWKDLKIGAGGFITGIDIGPDNTMVIRTDTYGAYVWSGSEWQQLVTSASMPVTDRTTFSAQGVYEVRIAPSNTNIFYMMYNGYVYRSADKGTSWAKTSLAHVVEDPNVDSTKLNGQKMAVDPANPDVVYVGTPQNGLFVTTDGGANWNNINLPVGTSNSSGQYPGISGLVFDQTSGIVGGRTNVVYASSHGQGVYESNNGGVSWSHLTGGPSSIDYATTSNTGVYYAVGDGNALWRYAGSTWTKLLTADINGFHSVAVDPFDPAHIVLQTPGGNINQSVDGGATWSGTNWTNRLSATDIPWLTNTNGYMGIGGSIFDQLIPGKLWVSDGVGVWNTVIPSNFTWQSSTVWNSQNVGIEQLVANEIVVPPGGKPVVGSWDRSFFYVDDPEHYPTDYGAGAPNKFSMGWSVDYASSSPSFLVGINDWWGVEQSGYSNDGGKTWNQFSTMPSFAGQAIGGSIAASSPKDIVWAPANRAAPQYTKDGGLSWHSVNLPGVTDWTNFDFAYYLDKRTVTADRVLSDTFYLYYAGINQTGDNSSGVFKSTNGGDTWTKVFSGEISPFSAFNSRIEAVPGEAGNLFFTGGPQGGATHPGGQSFFQSTDGGATWNAVPNVLEVMTFGFGAPAIAGGYPSIYIVGWVNSVYGIYQSNDDAQSWKMIGEYPNESLDTIRTISGDPNIYGQVYVGFGGSGYAYLPAVPAAGNGTAQLPAASTAPIVAAPTAIVTVPAASVGATVPIDPPHVGTAPVIDGTHVNNIQTTSSTSPVESVNSVPSKVSFGSIVRDIATPEGRIYALYETTLGRAPDMSGFESFTAALNSGAKLSDLAQAMLSSSEHTSRSGNVASTTDAFFINELYQNAFNRPAEATGLHDWEKALAGGMSRATVATSIAQSPEAKSHMAPAFQTGVFVPNAHDSEVAHLYYGILGRAPSAGELGNWSHKIASSDMARDFLGSKEASYGLAGLDDATFVDALYKNALGRPADASGSQAWLNFLNNGHSRSEVAFGISESQEATVHVTNVISAIATSGGTKLPQTSLMGSYIASTFVTSSDGHGGTFLTEPGHSNTSGFLVQPQYN